MYRRVVESARSAKVGTTTKLRKHEHQREVRAGVAICLQLHPIVVLARVLRRDTRLPRHVQTVLAARVALAEDHLVARALSPKPIQLKSLILPPIAVFLHPPLDLEDIQWHETVAQALGVLESQSLAVRALLESGML
eukprot:scaffold36300_cov123-Isochrysis_galbana.AAC.1